MRCSEGKCGLNDLRDNICCYFCEFKDSCGGFCTAIDREFTSEDDINDCENAIED